MIAIVVVICLLLSSTLCAAQMGKRMITWHEWSLSTNIETMTYSLPKGVCKRYAGTYRSENKDEKIKVAGLGEGVKREGDACCM